MITEHGHFDTKSGVLWEIPRTIVKGIGSITAATTIIARDTYRDLRPVDNQDINVI